ncbi:MAG: aminotransferase class V-fold PLP-dependent enzyme, partial [Candidatus Bathyarchaeota archaeon]|nr:aminotransferase class V-fold PLP-dependent enzyme [Candidatus Bathyarchaeota archaeon]
MLDPYEVRKDFPILSVRRSDGKPLVYLDNAATSLKPRYVIEAIVEYYERYTVNVHRGVYRLSQEAT